MRGEAQVSNSALPLKFSGCRHTPIFLKRPFEKSSVVDSMEREQLDALETEVLHGRFKSAQELRRILEWSNLRLHDHLLSRQAGQDASELHLRGAITTRRLEMIDPQLQGPVDGRFQIVLILGGNVAGWHVLPLILITHSPAGENGHLQPGAAKTAVLHAGWYATANPWTQRFAVKSPGNFFGPQLAS